MTFCKGQVVEDCNDEACEEIVLVPSKKSRFKEVVTYALLALAVRNAAIMWKSCNFI